VALIALAPASLAAAATVNIMVVDNAFSPRTPTINQGDTVLWTWVGGNPHTVTSGTCCTPDMLFVSTTKTSGTFSFTFNNVGTFPYFCAIHGASMTGSITVQASNPLNCTPTADRLAGNPPLDVQFMANPSGG